MSHNMIHNNPLNLCLKGIDCKASGAREAPIEEPIFTKIPGPGFGKVCVLGADAGVEVIGLRSRLSPPQIWFKATCGKVTGQMLYFWASWFIYSVAVRSLMTRARGTTFSLGGLLSDLGGQYSTIKITFQCEPSTCLVSSSIRAASELETHQIDIRWYWNDCRSSSRVARALCTSSN